MFSRKEVEGEHGTCTGESAVGGFRNHGSSMMNAVMELE